MKKSSSVQSIPVKIIGLLSVINRDDANKYFKYRKKTWIPQKKRTKLVEYPLGFSIPGSDPDQIGVGYGGISYLKKNNPYFADKLVVTEAESLKSFRPLDLELLKDLDVEWRDLQLEIIKDCSLRIVSNVVAGMATGKTLIMLALAYMASHQGQNVLFTSPTLKTRQNFINLAADLKLDNVVGYDEVRGGFLQESGKIIVANSHTVNTDINAGYAKDLVESVKTLITDESQNWTRKGWNHLLLNLPNLHRLAGFSATSVKEEEEFASFKEMDWHSAAVINVCGPVTYRTSQEDTEKHTDLPDLIEFPFSWDMVKYSSLRKVRAWNKLEQILYANEARNNYLSTLIEVLQDNNRITVVPINDRNQIAKILKKLKHANKVICWYGQDVIRDYNGKKISSVGIEEKFENGTYNTILATSHIDVGWDLPILNCTLLQEGKDYQSIVQKSGRVIRKSDVTPIVINFSDEDDYVFNAQAAKRTEFIEEYYSKNFFRLNSIEELDKYLKENGRKV